MIILGPLIQVLNLAIELYIWVVIISAILSWLIAFNVLNTANRFVHTAAHFLVRITEPALRPIRRYVPSFGGIDVSPVILILVLIFCQLVLGRLLYALEGSAY